MNYDSLLASADALIENEKHEISLLSNISAFIYQYIPNLNWSGFYLNKNEVLILGPFQGKIACSIIEKGKGVCGTSFLTRKTIVVPNVHLYDNHIACDSASNSEVVIPIIINNNVYGVLDVDSPLINRFDDELVVFLEKIVDLLVKKLSFWH